MGWIRSQLFSPSSEVDSFQQQENSSAAQVTERYRAFRQLTEPEEVTLVRDRDDEYQTLRHVVLLLVLSCSMFVVISTFFNTKNNDILKDWKTWFFL